MARRYVLLHLYNIPDGCVISTFRFNRVTRSSVFQDNSAVAIFRVNQTEAWSSDMYVLLHSPTLISVVRPI